MTQTWLTNAALFPVPLAIAGGLMLACLVALIAFETAEANRPRRRRAKRRARRC